MATPIDALLAPGYLDGLEGLELGELRRRRHECHEVETGLSYVRRLVQGRLDIVHAELARREGGAGGADLEELIAQLPTILAEHTGGPSRGPLPEVVAPSDIEALTAPVDAILNAEQLATLPSMEPDAVRALADRLSQLEQEVSAQRRALHERIDALQQEIVKRYKTGEATVDALLS